jgi:molybdopterin synthase sulfur carrier subunit
MIRVILPPHLRTLSHTGGEVELAVEGQVTQRAVLDALEARYPMLRGTIRDHVTQRRRAFLRFFACEQDLSNEPPDAPLPAAVAAGAEPLLIVGAMAGGRGSGRGSWRAGVTCLDTSALSSVGGPAGNDLSAVTPVDTEIRIGGEDDRVSHRLAHPHEAGIGQAHRDVCVLLHQIQDAALLLGEMKGGDQSAAAQQRGQRGPAPRAEEVKGFGQSRFARLPR